MDPLKEVHGIRVAVEGCVSKCNYFNSVHLNNCIQGHGTLNAIYTSIEKACEARGWDGVDLLIIGGDFQVREESVVPS